MDTEFSNFRKEAELRTSSSGNYKFPFSLYRMGWIFASFANKHFENNSQISFLMPLTLL